MLEDLHIKDFALIESASLEFSGGFTVLTGETGAGKSILIGALSFLLGGKADSDSVRAGAHEAAVSGTFLLDAAQKGAFGWLSAHGIEAESAGDSVGQLFAGGARVLLRRLFRDTGKSGAWIQAVPVTRGELAEFAAFLADIHGQHDHQSLLRASEHRRFLDAYAGIEAEVDAFAERYATLAEKRREYAALADGAEHRAEKIDLLSFAVREIEEAKLSEGEDEALQAEESRLLQFEKLYTAVEDASALLSGGEQSILPLAKRLNGALSTAEGCDQTLAATARRTESAFYELADIADELRAYSRALAFDGGRLEAVQERLALLFRLKKKYAAVQSPLAEVAAYAESAKAELAALEQGAESRSELERAVSTLERDVRSRAESLSAKRKQAAATLSTAAEAALAKVGMTGARFSVRVAGREGAEAGKPYGAFGADAVEFLFSANPGAPEKPLAKIASGGEISRTMLALKTVLAEADPVGTLVFDEIDSGIGGEASVAVGSHLQKLALKRQVLCITHLASIAACAERHLKIEKRAEGEGCRSAIGVRALSGEERVAEIARMLAGDSASAQSREHARALLGKDVLR